MASAMITYRFLQRPYEPPLYELIRVRKQMIRGCRGTSYVDRSSQLLASKDFAKVVEKFKENLARDFRFLSLVELTQSDLFPLDESLFSEVTEIKNEHNARVNRHA